MKKILVLVLMLGFAIQADAAMIPDVEDFEGVGWSPGTSPGAGELANGDTIRPDTNGWTIYNSTGNPVTAGAIGINHGVGYLGTVGAEPVLVSGEDYRYYGASIYKFMAEPVFSGTHTLHALLKLSDTVDNGYAGLWLHSTAIPGSVSVNFIKSLFGDGAPREYASMKAIGNNWAETDLQHPMSIGDITDIGWFAAELTVTINTDGDNSVSARWRDVNDEAEEYIGPWHEHRDYDPRARDA